MVSLVTHDTPPLRGTTGHYQHTHQTQTASSTFDRRGPPRNTLVLTNGGDNVVVNQLSVCGRVRARRRPDSVDRTTPPLQGRLTPVQRFWWRIRGVTTGASRRAYREDTAAVDARGRQIGIHPKKRFRERGGPCRLSSV